jgi:hypothetical protein
MQQDRPAGRPVFFKEALTLYPVGAPLPPGEGTPAGINPGNAKRSLRDDGVQRPALITVASGSKKGAARGDLSANRKRAHRDYVPSFKLVAGASIINKASHAAINQRIVKNLHRDYVSSFKLVVGWKMGIEPTASWATTRCSNQLSYFHRGG